MTQHAKKSTNHASNHKKQSPFQSLEAVQKTEEKVLEMEREGLKNAVRTAEGINKAASECVAACSDNIYASICADSRHTNVTLIVREPIFRRTFGSWRMGYLAADSATLSVLEGADGIINAQDELVKLDSGRAKKLLAAFASGRWQLKISDN